jgi:hypothetical protein
MRMARRLLRATSGYRPPSMVLLPEATNRKLDACIVNKTFPAALSRAFPAEMQPRKLCHVAATNLVRSSGLYLGTACHHFLK